MLVLREISIIYTFIPLLIVVNNVEGFRREELVDLLVLEHLIKQPNLIHSGLHSSISNSGDREKTEEEEVQFPEECLVGHQEAESRISDQRPGPSIITSVKPLSDLVDVVRRPIPPLIVVKREEVVRVLELSWISLSLVRHLSPWSHISASKMEVVVVISLRRSEPKVVETVCGCLPEESLGVIKQGLKARLETSEGGR